MAETGKKVARLVLALGLFGAGVMALFAKFIGPAASEKRLEFADKADSAIFYHQIGSAPVDFAGVGAEATAPQTRFTLEVTKAQDKQKADQLVKDLAREGVEAFYTPLHVKGKVFYRVRIGIYPSQDQAESASRDLATRRQLATTVARL